MKTKKTFFKRVLAVLVIALVTVGSFNSYALAQEVSRLTYEAHSQKIGWQSEVSEGAISGTTGRALRLEALKIKLSDELQAKGDIEYRVHVKGKGWLPWVKNGSQAGTTGESRRAEAVEIRLTGELSTLFDVEYQVHVKSKGWLSWVKNGAQAGTTGESRRAEAVKIRLVEKASSPSTDDKEDPEVPEEPSTPAPTPETIKYSVTFRANAKDVTSPATQQVKSGAAAIQPATPTRAGYTFNGWYKTNEATAFDFATKITEDTTLYAKWLANRTITPQAKFFNDATGVLAVKDSADESAPALSFSSISGLSENMTLNENGQFSITGAPSTAPVTATISYTVSATANDQYAAVNQTFTNQSITILPFSAKYLKTGVSGWSNPDNWQAETNPDDLVANVADITQRSDYGKKIYQINGFAGQSFTVLKKDANNNLLISANQLVPDSLNMKFHAVADNWNYPYFHESVESGTNNAGGYSGSTDSNVKTAIDTWYNAAFNDSNGTYKSLNSYIQAVTLANPTYTDIQAAIDGNGTTGQNWYFNNWFSNNGTSWQEKINAPDKYPTVVSVEGQKQAFALSGSDVTMSNDDWNSTSYINLSIPLQYYVQNIDKGSGSFIWLRSAGGYYYHAGLLSPGVTNVDTNIVDYNDGVAVSSLYLNLG